MNKNDSTEVMYNSAVFDLLFKLERFQPKLTALKILW